LIIKTLIEKSRAILMPLHDIELSKWVSLKLSNGWF